MPPVSALNRRLALAGLLASGAGLLGLPFWWLSDGPLALASLVVGLSAILPALVLGVVGSAAQLAARGWGRIVTIVALGLGLAVSLSYGVVWLVLVPQQRGLTAAALALLWLLQLLLLIHWSRSSGQAPPGPAALQTAASATDTAGG